MCNLYTTKVSAAEVANYFSAKMANQFNAGPSDVYPGGQGMVVVNEAGERVLRSMTWGFPLAQKSKKTGEPLKPRPVNNTRAEKLDSFFWRYSFEQRRCLIPLTRFAEAEGARGAMTRTWFSAPEENELLVAAGIWRTSDEWGDCYSMIMTDANDTVAPVHDRMPVVLAAKDRAVWTGGSVDAARDLCVPFAGALTVDRTDEPWYRR